jgi:hypothetical protein
MTGERSHSSSRGLVEILESLRAVMAEERRSIARLDMPGLEAITARKRVLCSELSGVIGAGEPSFDPGMRRLVARVRVELGANAALIAAASEAIASALGVERDDRYDRAARCHTQSRPMRVIAY